MKEFNLKKYLARFKQKIVTRKGYQSVQQSPLEMPLTFKISNGGTINWTASNCSLTRTIEYKLNNDRWKSIASNTTGAKINVNAGDKIQFRGNNATYGNEALHNTFSGSTAGFEIEGNIMSLINSTNFATDTTLTHTFTFNNLFSKCTGLTSAENLILPATTLTIGCYFCMFKGCSSLTATPELPATKLAPFCYASMFWNCTSLTTVPSDYLPSTTLVDNCYDSMFYNCASLATSPELPATTLAQSCYNSMFCDCKSLTTVPELPATKLAISCYNNMFCNCTSLKMDPELPATALTPFCYSSMFAGCTSLTTATELPATTLSSGCYEYMFYGCTKLNHIKCLAEDISASNCTYNWVYGVASTGIFVKNPSVMWVTDVNGIPTGWTIIDAA